MIESLDKRWERLDGECRALNARVADAQREVTALAAEYDSVCRSLATDETNEDLARSAISLREKITIAEATLQGIQGLLDDKQKETAIAYAALAKALTDQAAANRQRELAEKSKRLKQLCRDAMQKRDELAKEMGPLNKALERAEGQVARAENAHDNHFRRVFDDFAEDSEVEDHMREGLRLQDALHSARKTRNDALDAIARHRRLWLDTCTEVAHALQVFNLNVPPEYRNRRIAAGA